MLPETDLEYLMHGDPDFVESRLRRLGMLSPKGLERADEVRALIAAARARYSMHDTGPSYVHSLTQELFDRRLLNEEALELHWRGKRSTTERWNDKEFMAWIGDDPAND